MRYMDLVLLSRWKEYYIQKWLSEPRLEVSGKSHRQDTAVGQSCKDAQQFRLKSQRLPE